MRHTYHLWHTQTHSQEINLKPFCLFVSVSISLYTSRTTELIEKVKRLQTDDRRKKSAPVSSIPQEKEWTPASLFYFARHVASFMICRVSVSYISQSLLVLQSITWNDTAVLACWRTPLGKLSNSLMQLFVGIGHCNVFTDQMLFIFSWIDSVWGVKTWALETNSTLWQHSQCTRIFMDACTCAGYF